MARSIARLAALAAAGVTLCAAGANAQVACPDEDDALGCYLHEETLESQAGLWEGLDFDTGFVPGGSPLQLRARLFLGASSEVTMTGTLRHVWPPALTVDLQSELDAGLLLLDWGFEAGITFKYDIGIADGEVAVPIPFIPDDVRLRGETMFTPFLLPGAAGRPATASDATQRFQLISLGLSDIFVDLVILDGGFRIDAAAQLGLDYEGTRVEVGSETIDQDGASVQLRPESGPFGSALDYTAHPYGEVTHTGGVVLYPTIFIEIDILIDTIDFNFEVAEIPIDIAGVDSEVDFGEFDVHVPFPDVNVEPRRIDFGTTLIGETAQVGAQIYNNGETVLEVRVEPFSNPAFVAARESLQVPPGARATLLLEYTPEQVDGVAQNLRLRTNDPDAPLVQVTMVGRGEMPEIPDAGPAPEDAGDEADAAVADAGTGGLRAPAAGCGCAAAGAPRPVSGWWGWLALAGLGLVARRRYHA